MLNFLNSALKDNTSIIITHRISSFLELDPLIVLDPGQVVEEGIHDDLIQLKGYYYDLLQHQMKENRA